MRNPTSFARMYMPLHDTYQKPLCHLVLLALAKNILPRLIEKFQNHSTSICRDSKSSIVDSSNKWKIVSNQSFIELGNSYFVLLSRQTNFNFGRNVATKLFFDPSFTGIILLSCNNKNVETIRAENIPQRPEFSKNKKEKRHIHGNVKASLKA